jgi:sucrose-6-phosphate hydrolase SacC (GH32 family)
MVIVGDRCYDFYRSKNLTDWKRQSHVATISDCPDIFRLFVDGNPAKPKWVLASGHGDCTIGDFDGEKFVPESQTRVVFGDFHAPQTFHNAPDDGKRRVQMSWLRFSPPGMPFRQMISLPIELTLRSSDDGGTCLFANPAREIENLRTENRAFPDAELSEGPMKLDRLSWELTDTEMTVELNGARQLKLSIWGQDATYDVQSATLTLGKAKARAEPVDGALKLRLLVDRSVIDICANDGRALLMAGMCPDRSKPALECSATGGAAIVKNIKAYRLKSVW